MLVSLSRKFLTTQLGKQFMSFATVGAIATLIHYAVLVFLTELAYAGPVAASAVGFSVSAIFNYLGNYFFTFSSTERHHLAVIKFAVVAISGLALNTFGMYIAVRVVGLYYLLAQVLCTGIVLVWNFTLNRAWTFRALA